MEKNLNVNKIVKDPKTEYQMLFNHLPEGFALHEIIFDTKNKPIDYRFLAVNPAFERLTGLKAKDIIGKTVLQVLPDTEPIWIERYAKVAMTGESIKFENYNGGLGKHYEITAYSPEKNRFAIIFLDITERKRVTELVRETNELYEGILSTQTAGIYQIRVIPGGFEFPEPKYVYEFVNDRYCFITGHTREEHLADPMLTMKLIHPDEYQEWIAKNNSSDKTLQRFEWEGRIIVKGQIRWVHFESRPKTQPNGDRIWTGLLLDITERKQTKEALLENKSRLEFALRSLNMGTWYWDIVEDKRYFDEQVCRLLGIDPLTFKDTAKEFFDILHPEDMEVVKNSLNRALENDELYQPVYRVIWKDKSVHHITARGRLSRDKSGQPLRLNGLIWDITDLKKAEDTIAAEKERLAVTLRSIGDGVITTDVEGRITDINKTAEELTGWKRHETIGKPLEEVFQIISEITRKPHENPVHKVLKTGSVVELANHTLLVSKSKREYIIADSGAPIRDRRSQIIGIVLVFRDITEKQKLFENAQRTDKLESLGILAGGIAHDFNNLLGGMFGYIDLAKTQCTKSDKISEYLDKALKTFSRAKNLTHQLLTFSKGGAPCKKTASLGPVIMEVTTFALSGSNCSCSFDMAEDLWSCDYDVNQIGQVVDNIVINAIQAMPMGGKLFITAKNLSSSPAFFTLPATKKYIHITFKDSGIGIPPSIVQRIFDPFFTTKQKGNGLGLATAYSIIKKHEGDITVESTIDKGTTFHIFLPASVNAYSEKELNANFAFQGKGHVLIMDDEESIRETTGELLKDLGYEVEFAQNGTEALNMIKDFSLQGKPFTAVIMDLTIPGEMGGKEAINELRKTDQTLTVFVSSGYSQDPIMANPTQYGFNDKISKPFQRSQLFELFRRNLHENNKK
ncbi:MAG: PAS domain S-box protein [Candidatus Riflebacteria bacterium]|nr:PAS domain S-box protein [Candidatus Riflebacteria bacterium]